MTPSEAFVAMLCTKSFMRLWVHPNPLRIDGKELCDCLVVCGEDVVIVSVKEIEFKDTGDQVGRARWIRKAVEKSSGQIYGAERYIRQNSTFTRNDGRVVTLPPEQLRRYHRIVVAMGADGAIPVAWGQTKHGFVHICNEHSTGVVLGILDTIADFVRYLDQVERIVEKGGGVTFNDSGVEDLATAFLISGYSFEHLSNPKGPDPHIVVDGRLWKRFYGSQEMRRLRERIHESYAWDGLIETLSDYILDGTMMKFPSWEPSDSYYALEVMALESRTQRLWLGKGILGFLKNSDTDELIKC